MPKGAYTAKQERKADHIAEGYRQDGVSKEEAEERARTVLTAYRPHLDRLVELLVAQETLEFEELKAALGDLPKGLPSVDDLAAEKARQAGTYRTPR